MEKLSTATILQKASQESATKVQDGITKAKIVLEEAEKEAAILKIKARENAAKLYNQSIDSIFLADERGVRICNQSGNEQNFFRTPSRAYCMTMDPLNEKLYFIIETASQPINEKKKLVEVSLFSTSITGSDVTIIKEIQYSVPVEAKITGSLDIQPVEGRIVWISPVGIIYDMDTKGDHYRELGKTEFSPNTTSVSAILSASGTLYWTAMERETSQESIYGIWSMDKDSNFIKLLSYYSLPSSKTSEFFPKIQIDESNKRIYWNSLEQIESITLEGTDHMIIYQSASIITGLEIDLFINRLYWLEQNHVLIRSTLDGKITEKALLLQNNEYTVRNLYISTKSDEAAGKLHLAQMERQRAIKSTIYDINQANKNADIKLAPIQEAYSAAKAKFDQDLAPAQAKAANIITPAKTQYVISKNQADDQIAKAKGDSQKAINEAKTENDKNIENAKVEAKIRIDEENKKLEDARAKKEN